MVRGSCKERALKIFSTIANKKNENTKFTKST
jgi:hypothetical protein